MSYATNKTMFFGRGSVEAGADLSASSGLGFKFSGATAVLATANACHGVIIDGMTASGDQIACGFGECLAIAAEAIAMNQYITTDSAGKFVVASTSSDKPIGIALSKAAADGDVFQCFIYGPLDEAVA